MKPNATAKKLQEAEQIIHNREEEHQVAMSEFADRHKTGVKITSETLEKKKAALKTRADEHVTVIESVADLAGESAVGNLNAARALIKSNMMEMAHRHKQSDSEALIPK